MIKSSIAFFFLLFFYSITVFAQDSISSADSEVETINAKIQEYQMLAHSNPKKAAKELSDIKMKCEKKGHDYEAMRSSMTLVKIYYNNGDYKKTIEESKTVEKYTEKLHDFEYLSDVYRLRSLAYGELGLLDESLKELEKSLRYADEIEKNDKHFYKKALIYEGYAGLFDKKEDDERQVYYRQKSVNETKKMSENHPITINAKYQNLCYQYSSMAYVYSNQKKNDSAQYYFDEALKIIESRKYDIYPNVEATLLSDLAKFYDANGQFKNAVLFAKRAERLEKQVPMAYIRKNIFHSLFNSYAETGKIDSSKYYLKLYTALNDSLLKSEKKSIMTPVNQIISDNEAENKTQIRNILLIVAVVIVLISLVFWFYWKKRNDLILRKYEKFLNKVKSETKVELKQEDSFEVQDEAKSSVNITDETTKMILQKLEKFENSDKYLKKEVSLTWLANNLNTNTKYLSEVIKTYKNKSFNSYLNGLRIDYITRKLVEEPVYREYKIGYLADEGGYKSRQVFVISFKKETGFTPSYFIENLKNEFGD